MSACHASVLRINSGFRLFRTGLEFLMARVTVEDCVDKVPNRFELVMLASHRAREITAGD
jgi:hypothetical protein